MLNLYRAKALAFHSQLAKPHLSAKERRKEKKNMAARVGEGSSSVSADLQRKEKWNRLDSSASYKTARQSWKSLGSETLEDTCYLLETVQAAKRHGDMMRAAQTPLESCYSTAEDLHRGFRQHRPTTPGALR